MLGPTALSSNQSPASVLLGLRVTTPHNTVDYEGGSMSFKTLTLCWCGLSSGGLKIFNVSLKLAYSTLNIKIFLKSTRLELYIAKYLNAQNYISVK